MLFQTASHPVFQLLAQTAHVCFRGRKRVHTRLSEKNHTQRLTRRNRGLPSLDHSAALCRQRNTLYSATLLYTYISRFSVNPHYQQREKSGETAAINFIPNRFSSRFSTSLTNGPRLLSQAKAGTHSAFGERSHTRAHTAKQGLFRMGPLSLPSIRAARSPTSPGRVSERQVLPLWGFGRVLPKNAESLRNSDALMRVAVPRRRGPAGLRDPCSHIDCSAGRLCCKLSGAVVR